MTKINLPATFSEAAALQCAREVNNWFCNNSWLDYDEVRMRNLLTSFVSCGGPRALMDVIDSVCAGWDFAEIAHEVLRDLILEYEHRKEEMPPPLKAYEMKIIAGWQPTANRTGPKKSATFFRDICVMVTIVEVAEKSGLRQTRNPASPRPSACSVAAAVWGMPENTVLDIRRKYGRF